MNTPVQKKEWDLWVTFEQREMAGFEEGLKAAGLDERQAKQRTEKEKRIRKMTRALLLEDLPMNKIAISLHIPVEKIKKISDMDRSKGRYIEKHLGR